MDKLILNIDGPIGNYAYSKQWLREMLDGHDNESVEAQISSLGGDVDHALAMHDRFVLHGNINVRYFGFNASSATIIGMGAKTRSISSNGFFLVHKVMSWIDEFGYLNEDEIEELILRLTKDKDENSKMTLQTAKIYADVTGKPIKDILQLMKEGMWLNAEEALEWGFVDKIEKLSSKHENLFNNLARVAMITSSGLPPIPQSKSNPSAKPQTQMNTAFTHINQLLGFEGIESTAEGVFLSLEQMQTINDAFAGHDGAVASIQALLDTAVAERDTAQGSLATANTTIAERDTEITRITGELTTANADLQTERTESQRLNTELADNASTINAIEPTIAAAATFAEKVTAIRAIIARKPGAKPIGTMTTEDPDTPPVDAVDWDAINNLPHNKHVK